MVSGTGRRQVHTHTHTYLLWASGRFLFFLVDLDYAALLCCAGSVFVIHEEITTSMLVAYLSTYVWTALDTTCANYI